MELDRYLSSLTRKLPHLRGMARIIKPLRRYFSKKYNGKDNRWADISDYDGDIKMRLDRTAYMSGGLYWLGTHHWREMDYLRKYLEPDMCFIDIGANQGEFSLFAAKYLKQGFVYSFEPQNDMYKMLEKNIELNSFENIKLHNFGLGEKEEILKLYTSGDTVLHAGWHEGLFTTFPTSYRNKFVQDVSIKRMDNVFSMDSITRVDMIKIDVEGAELFVLKGAKSFIKKFKPKLILEVNEDTFRQAGYSTKDLINFLDSFDYSYYSFKSRGVLRKLNSKSLIKNTNSFNILCK